VSSVEKVARKTEKVKKLKHDSSQKGKLSMEE
jgi:hypothetical protein